MSCIAGLFHLGGGAIERGHLDRMLAPMKPRAPDGDQVFCSGPVGLAQSFLRTGASAAEGPGQLTLDGEVFITADARVDGRAELIAKLRAAGRRVAQDPPHAELILHAYAVFGDNFVDQLIGDFAFALWDARQGKLICVRDHFGVRPFYYFQTENLFGFASDIDALRAHPAVSARLHDTAVADFLLFGACCESEHTIYQDIRCLPPATRLAWTAAGSTTSRYWSLPDQTETRYGSQAEYVERFVELFDQAVSDRLPGGPIAVQLSGGMDSTSIAAAAIRRARATAHAVTGFHTTYSGLTDSDELALAQLTADHLGINMVVQDLGQYPLFAGRKDKRLQTAFPIGSAQLALHADTMRQISSAGGRVLLSGYAADALFATSSTYYPRLFRSGRLLKLLREITHHVRNTGSLSGTGLRTLLRGKGSPPSWQPRMPTWVASALADRVGLASRWRHWLGEYQRASEAREQLNLPWPHRQFEGNESLKTPVVVRYPFLDRRVVEYLLSLPNFMIGRKKILRMAMRDSLPIGITSRPKTVVDGDIMRKMVTSGNMEEKTLGFGLDLPFIIDEPVFRAEWQAHCAADTTTAEWSSDLMVLPIALAHWMHNKGNL